MSINIKTEELIKFEKNIKNNPHLVKDWKWIKSELDFIENEHLMIAKIDILLNNGMDINIYGTNNSVDDNSLMFIVCNYPLVLRYCMSKGININCTNYENKNVLFFIENTESATILMENNINIKQRSKDNTLFYCCNTSINVLNLFADIINQNEKGYSGVPFTFMLEDINKFQGKLDLNILDYKGNSCLFNTNIRNMIDLIDAGIDVNCINHAGDNALTHRARDHVITKKLIEKGINVHHVNNSGRNVLFNYGLNIFSLELLAQKGINFSQVDNEGNNCLKYHLHLSKFSFLISQGLDINQQNHQGNSLIFELITGDEPELVHEFFDYIKYGCDLNIINKKGNNLFMHKLEHALTEKKEGRYSDISALIYLGEREDFVSLNKPFISNIDIMLEELIDYVRNEEDKERLMNILSMIKSLSEKAQLTEDIKISERKQTNRI